MFEASQHPYPYSSYDRRPRRNPTCLILACIALLLAGGLLAYLDFQMKNSLTDLGRELARADSDATRAKADSDRSVSLAADLKLQLDQAKGEQAEALAKVRTGLTQAADAQRIAVGLQAEVDQARATESNLQIQLKQARSDLQQEREHSAAIEARLSQAGDESSKLGLDLAQSQAETQGLRAQLAKTAAPVARVEAPVAAPPPPPPHPLPLEQSFGKAGSRFSVRIKNTGPNALKVAIAVTGPETRSKSTKIKSGKTLDLGKFEPGSQVVVRSDGFDPLSFEVP